MSTDAASQTGFERDLQAYVKYRRPDKELSREAVRSGISFDRVETLMRELSIPAHQMAPFLGISERTLHRRKELGHLDVRESDRFWRIWHIYQVALEAFDGKSSHVNSWLTRENKTLGGESPLEHLDTEIGMRTIEQMLTTIEYMTPA